MGLYDEVNFKCPSCENGMVSFQTKADECCMQVFPPNEVPLHVADDIENDRGHCDECYREFAAVRLIKNDTVPMTLMVIPE